MSCWRVCGWWLLWLTCCEVRSTARHLLMVAGRLRLPDEASGNERVQILPMLLLNLYLNVSLAVSMCSNRPETC